MKEEHIKQTKQFRKDLDNTLQHLKAATAQGSATVQNYTDFRQSRERSVAITKIQEAIMWLGMDLKAMNEESPGVAPNPYPESYDPTSPKIEPTADGLSL